MYWINYGNYFGGELPQSMVFGDFGFHRDCTAPTGLTTGTILVARYLSRWCLVILGFTETTARAGLTTGTILTQTTKSLIE